MNAKPSPHPTPINEPFLRGCNRNELWLQRCAQPACRKFVFYPRVCCPHCGAGGLTWERATGRHSGHFRAFARWNLSSYWGIQIQANDLRH